MFDKIKKTYFGERVVSGVVEIPTKSRVVVTFADDKKPQSEEMHVSEWENGQSEEPIEKPDKKQEWFVKRTQKMRQAAVDLLVGYNPRFAELKKVVNWIEEGITMTYKGVVAKVFGVADFDSDATVDLVTTKFEETMKDPAELTADWTSFEKEVFAIIRRDKVNVNSVLTQSLLGGLQQKLEKVINESVAEALGGSDEARRCNVFDEILKK